MSKNLSRIFLFVQLVLKAVMIYCETKDRVDIEDALLSKLFKNYTKTMRPSSTVKVKFALQLNQIVNVIEKDQIVELNTFIDHEWIDERLKWDPTQYDNIDLLRINIEMLWV
jgi:hypothetical protein